MGDAVKAVFHLGGELVVDQLGEVRLEQLGHGEGEPAGDQRTATLVYVTAIHDCGDNARVSGRATDLLGFQRLDQRGLGVAGRRLGFMAVRFDVACLDLLADAHRRQGGVGFGGVTPDGLGVRLAGGSSLVRASPSAGSGGLGLRPSPVAFIKPGNSMTVPDAWNTASPSVGPAGADRRTVAVEPVASAIWQASVRCQISVYRRSWSPGSLEASSSGSWKREPAGRIHSWASCAPAVLVAYCLGSAERNLSPKW